MEYEDPFTDPLSIPDPAPVQNITPKPPAPPTVEPVKPYVPYWEKQQAAQSERLNSVLRQASTVDPVNRAEAQKLSTETGIPLDLIGRNADDIRREWMLRRSQTAEIAKQNPIVAAQLQDREFASISWDDIPNLSATEKTISFITNAPSDLAAGWKRSFLTNEQGRLGNRAQIGTSTPEDMKRYQEIEGLIKGQGKLGYFGNVGTVVGSMADTFSDSAEYGAYAALAAGTTVGVLGQLGPQIALPEELVTVPTAMVSTFWAATSAKMASNSYVIESGLAYMDMIDAGVDRNTAQYASMGVGLVNAGLEVVGFSAITAPIKKQLHRLVAEEVATAMLRPTARQALTGAAAGYATVWAKETGTEIAQEIVSVAGQEMAGAFTKNEFESLIATPGGRKQIAERLVETAIVVGQGMSLVALPGAALTYRADIKAARQAESDQQFIEDLGASVDKSQVRKRNPAAYERFIEAQVAGTPVADIYVNAEQLTNVLAQQGMTIDQLEVAVPGIKQQVEEASVADGDVLIPTSIYAAKIAGTDLGQSLKPHMRVTQDGMSVNEAVEFQGKQEEMRIEAQTVLEAKNETDKAFAQEASAVRQTIYSQIAATGAYTPNVSNAYANFVRDFVVTNAAKLGMSPQQFYDKYQYKIVGQQTQEAMASTDILVSEGFVNQATNEVLPTSNAFQTFYGNSVFKNEDGSAQVLYHGTVDSIDSFDLDHPNRKDSGWLGTGVYLTDNEIMAGMYADQKARSMGPKGQQVMPLYARLENPYYATQEEKQQIRSGGRAAADAFTDALKAEGYDGVILAVAPDANEIVVFEPSSVKSKFNDGTWSRETSQILSQQGPISTASGADIFNQRAQKSQAIGKPVPASVNAVSSVEANFEFAATKPFATNRAFKLEIQKRVQDAAKAAGVNLEEFNLGVEQYLVQSTLADALVALRTNPNAVGWYNEKVTKALNVLALVHPELATDPEAKFAFTWALAATSNGLKVNDNFKLAEQSYRAYKESSADPAQRRMPTNIQAGTAQKAINGAMKIYNDLIARDGFEVVEQFMTTMHTAKEVAAYTNTKVSGESPTTMVYGAAAIGPKIGNGFFANLYGHFEQLTMDRWLMRTWGRWTGTLVEENKTNIKIKREQLKTLIRTLSSAEKKSFEAILKIKMTLSNIDAVGVAIKKRSMLPANRELMNAIGFSKEAVAKLETLFGVPGGSENRVGLGDQLRKVGNSLAGYLDGQKEAPSGAVERGKIRKVFQQALTLLQQDHPSLTMADLQALLWYPEKRLYDAAKTKDEDADSGYEDDAAPDYANAAASLARSKGVSDEAINRTTKEVDDGIRANTISTGTPQRGAGELFKQARNGGGRYSAGSLAPLEGAPTVPGATGPDIRLVSVAERYAAANGIDLKRQSEYTRVNIDLARRISDAYEKMPNDPQNPVVAEAYQNLINQTKAQYQALVDAGYEFYFIDENNGADYLSSPFNAVRELRQDQRMGVYPTEAGFGQEAGVADGGVSNPMLADTGLVWMDAGGNSKRVLANDLFRAVHDAFGHSLEGAGFRAQGEENAWQAHVRLFTGSAVAAMTSETRGQNSWLHFGPNGEANTGASVSDTVFAEQKTGLMPEFTWLENRSGDQETMEQLGQQSQEGMRGGFDPKRLTTILYKGADYSTFLHETSHFFLSAYADMATMPDATPQMKADMQQILGWFGVEDLQTWNAMPLDEQRQYHEQFAYNYEIYLFEGKAPSIELQGMFQKFTRFLVSVYRSIRDDLNKLYRQENGRDLPILTDEIRSVMDRMLATEDQINQAEQVAGMAPMFQTQEQSGMDDSTWAAYQAMLDEAHDQAVSEMNQASVRQVKWLANARSKIIKALQKQAENLRKQVSLEVTEEVKNLPIYRTQEYLKRGLVDGEPSDYQVKLSSEEIEIMFGKGEMLDSIRKKFGFGKYGMLGKEAGIHPEQVAEMFGFESAYSMVQDLLNARSMKEEIDLRTDRRMLEENSDLMDERAVAAKAEELVHNEARARFIAVELRFMQKSMTPVRVMTAAAKQVAQEIVSGRKIGELKPRDHVLGEAKAARKAQALSKKGEAGAAAKAKQDQLVQNQLAKETLAAKQEVAKALEMFRKIFKSDKNMAKSRNMDLVNAARSILSAFNLGPEGVSPAQFIQKLQEYDPDLYAQLEPLIIEASSGGKDYKMMTMNEFRTMRDLIEALYYQARREKMVEIDGKMMEVEQLAGEMTARLVEIGLPTTSVGEREAASKRDRLARSFNTFKALLRRVEHWADATDGPKGPGVFTKYIWRPMSEATNKYRSQRNDFVKRYVDLVSKLDLKVEKIQSTELNYTFGSANGGIGKAELLGAMLHTGNSSNLRKLILGGRGANSPWGSLYQDGSLNTASWDAFVRRMIDEKVLTKVDFDFLQAVWDLNEEMKPIAQKAHKDIFGYYFNEVEATPMQTPFEVYRGGYVPAKVDPMLVGDATRNAKMEELEADFRQSMPSTGMGFTKGRVEYNKALDLDIRKMTSHIDGVLRFANIQPVVKDTLKLLRNKEFSDTLNAVDPGAIEHMLLPWLNRAARQQTSTSGMNRSMDKFWNAVRNRTGIGIMFANLSNALQQLTGYFPALLKVEGTYLKSALWDYMKRPHQAADEVAAMSPFMENRMQNQIFDIQETLNDLLLNPSKFEKTQKWTQKHGYFLQQAFQNQVDVVVWSATYNQTLAQLDKTVTAEAAHKEAISRADAAVRLTQDSLVSEDLSAVQVGSPFYKTLIQFTGYFNMLANLNAGAYIKIIRDMGFKGNKGKLLYTYVMGFGLPMLMADAIVRTLGGQWDDEDDDGYIDEVAEWFFMSQVRGATALIPLVGTAIAVPFNAFNDKPYDDRMSTSPSISTLEAATVGVVKAGLNLADPDKQVTGKNVRDILTLISLAVGIPVTVLGRPLGYAVDVERGKIRPTSEADYIRGLISGKASEESRK
jgi:hypothetical protein